MNYSTFRFALDFHKQESQMSIPARRGDTAIRLYISLTDGGTPYSIEAGCVAVFAGKSDNSVTLLHNCYIDSDSRIIYDFKESTTKNEGVIDCEIRLYGKDGERIATPRFTIVVSAQAVSDDDIDISDDTSAIDTILGAATEIEAAKDSVDKRASDAESAAQKAESSADEAQKWANGEGTVEGNDQYQKNAKYYAEEAEKQKNVAAQLVVDAQKWANGTDVTSDDPQYQKNAKYYSTLSQTYAGEASAYANIVGQGAKRLEASIDPSNYELTFRLISAVGGPLSEVTIDLPLESSVTEIDYDPNTKELIFKLRSGYETRVPLDNIVDGLATKAELGTGLGDKVDKITTARKLYGTNSAGVQTSYFVANDIGDDTGNPTLTIMTQAAVTAALNALDTKLDTKIAKNAEDIKKNSTDFADIGLVVVDGELNITFTEDISNE